MEFLALASSSAGCAYRLTCGTSAPLLIDAGIPFRQIQIGTNFGTSKLAGCLISHYHGDHCHAAKDLIKAGIHCYASQPTWDWLGIESHWAHPITNLVEFEVGDWRITPFDAVHDAEGTMGFVIQNGAEKALYLTDSAYCRYTFDDLTDIFIESNHSQAIMAENTISGRQDSWRHKRTANNHMSLERLCKMLAANDLTKVKSIHLLHLSDSNADADLFKETIQKATGVPVYVAPKFLKRKLH